MACMQICNYISYTSLFCICNTAVASLFEKVAFYWQNLIKYREKFVIAIHFAARGLVYGVDATLSFTRKQNRPFPQPFPVGELEGLYTRKENNDEYYSARRLHPKELPQNWFFDIHKLRSRSSDVRETIRGLCAIQITRVAFLYTFNCSERFIFVDKKKHHLFL